MSANPLNLWLAISLLLAADAAGRERPLTSWSPRNPAARSVAAVLAKVATRVWFSEVVALRAGWSGQPVSLALRARQSELVARSPWAARAGSFHSVAQQSWWYIAPTGGTRYVLPTGGMTAPGGRGGTVPVGGTAVGGRSTVFGGSFGTTGGTAGVGGRGGTGGFFPFGGTLSTGGRGGASPVGGTVPLAAPWSVVAAARRAQAVPGDSRDHDLSGIGAQ